MGLHVVHTPPFLGVASVEHNVVPVDMRYVGRVDFRTYTARLDSNNYTAISGSKILTSTSAVVAHTYMQKSYAVQMILYKYRQRCFIRDEKCLNYAINLLCHSFDNLITFLCTHAHSGGSDLFPDPLNVATSAAVVKGAGSNAERGCPSSLTFFS